MKYTDAIKKLEKITSQLQNNEIPIDQLQETIKTASMLIKECKKTLTETNKEIQSLIDEFESENK